MAVIKMGNKTLFTQTGNDEPVINNNVNINQVLATANFPAGHVVQEKNFFRNKLNGNFKGCSIRS